MASITALLWGFLAIAMKVAAEHVPVLTIVWFRFTFAFVVLAVGIGLREPARLRILRRPPPLAILAGIGLGLNYIGYVSGLHYTTPSNAQVLIQSAPLMLAVVGILLFRERLRPAQWIGIGIASAGLLLFAWNQHQVALVSPRHLLLGNLLIAGAAVSWVVYAALTKWLSGKGYNPQDINLVLYGLPAVTLWPLADFEVLATMSRGMWLLMVFLGANTLVAYGALGEAFRRVPAYQVSLIITLNPLITLVAIAILAGLEVTWLPPDRVGFLGYLAALLVVGGVVQVLLKAQMPREDLAKSE